MHILRYNESLENLEYQKEDIITFFSDLMDNDQITVNITTDHYLEFYSEFDYIKPPITDRTGIDRLLKNQNDGLAFYEELKVITNRLTEFDYNWSIKIDDNIVVVKVFYKTKVSLEDAFGNDAEVNEYILKKLFKEKYNLDLLKVHAVDYEMIAEIDINGSISENIWKKIKKDLLSITIKSNNEPLIGDINKNYNGAITKIYININ